MKNKTAKTKFRCDFRVPLGYQILPQKGGFYLLKKVLLTSIILIAALGFVAPFSSPTSAQENDYSISHQIDTNTLISLTNQARSQREISTLKTNSLLNQAASAKINDMFTNDYFAHTSPTGITGWYFIRTQGYRYYKAGENLAKDFWTSQGVFDAWMASSTHRTNILEPDFREIGVAVKDGKLNGQSTTLTVQFFGTQASTPPSTGGTVSASEDTYFSVPKPTLTYPQQNAKLNSKNPLIKGRGTANQTIKIQINQTQFETKTDSKGNFRYRLAVPLKDGKHKIKARTEINTYQSEWSKTINFTTDTIAPKLKNATFIPEDPEPGKKVTLLATTTEELEKGQLKLGDRTISLQKYQGLLKEVEQESLVYTATFAVPETVGDYSPVLSLRDESGNKKTIILENQLQVNNKTNSEKDQASPLSPLQSMVVITAFLAASAAAVVLP